MPKKFQTENTKATEAKARKAAVKDAETSKKQQQLEDEYWKEDDKHVLKKQQRKDEKEKKKTELLDRKKELQKLHDEELASIKTAAKPVPASSSKVTRTQAEAHREAIEAAAAAAAKTGADLPITERPLQENVNRIVVEGDEARTVDEALSLLSTKDADVDMHPEKRMKAAYLAYEEKNLPLVKEENPGLRLSQLKQIIRKNWNKAPENPLNQQPSTLGAGVPS